MGQILIVAIAVAVTAYLGPQIGAYVQSLGAWATTTTAAVAATTTTAAVAATTAISTAGAVVAGAITGAAASIASQAVGVATGIQSKFSWNSVALAALGGGIGGGLGASSKVSNALGKFSGNASIQAGLRGALGSALTQGVGVATGLQSEFSWAGVAAAGIGGGVRHSIGGNLGIAAGGIANAATRSAIEGSSFADGLRAAIPDIIGQVIGGAIGNGLLSKPEQQVSADPVANVAGVNGSISNGVARGANAVLRDTESRVLETVYITAKRSNIQWDIAAGIAGARATQDSSQRWANFDASFAQANHNFLVSNIDNLNGQITVFNDHKNRLYERALISDAKFEAGLLAKSRRGWATSSRLDAQFEKGYTSGNNMIALTESASSYAEQRALAVAINEGRRRAMEGLSIVVGGPVGLAINAALIGSDIADNGLTFENAGGVAASVILRKLPIPGGKPKPGVGDWQSIASKADINTITKGKSGIYKFIDVKTGVTYVGQSKDIAIRLKRHGARVTENSQIFFKEVSETVVGEGRKVFGKLAREVEEFREIRRITGGEAAKSFKAIANRVDPIGLLRRKLLGLNDATGLPK